MLSAILTLRHNKNLKLKEQIDFLDRLARLLTKHYTIKQALEFMCYDPQHKSIANQFSSLLQRGNTIDECFRSLAFHPLIISFINFSNESGHMSEHIINCNRLLKIKVEFQRKLFSILKYPLLLTMLSILIIIGLNTYLMPMFKNTFEAFGSSQSLKYFQVVIQSINVLSFMTFIFIILSIIGLIYLRKQSTEHKINIIQCIPYIKSYFSLIVSLQFSYQLYGLLDSGKNIQEALRIIKEQNEIQSISYVASLILYELSHGQSLYSSINPIPIIQDEMKWLIKRSGDTGTLSTDLYHYATFLLELLERQTKKALIMIQPIFYVFIGAIVMTIYILTLFPMYKLMQQL